LRFLWSLTPCNPEFLHGQFPCVSLLLSLYRLRHSSPSFGAAANTEHGYSFRTKALPSFQELSLVRFKTLGFLPRLFPLVDLLGFFLCCRTRDPIEVVRIFPFWNPNFFPEQVARQAPTEFLYMHPRPSSLRLKLLNISLR